MRGRRDTSYNCCSRHNGCDHHNSLRSKEITFFEDTERLFNDVCHIISLWSKVPLRQAVMLFPERFNEFIIGCHAVVVADKTHSYAVGVIADEGEAAHDTAHCRCGRHIACDRCNSLWPKEITFLKTQRDYSMWYVASFHCG